MDQNNIKPDQNDPTQSSGSVTFLIFIIFAGLIVLFVAVYFLVLSPETYKKNTAQTQIPDANSASQAETKVNFNDVPPIYNTCSFPELVLPADFFIYAGGGYTGKKLAIQIDDSGHQATEMQVFVNEARKPIVLMLGAYEPTIWQIKKTEPTQILAVVLSGHHKQVISGLPKNTPFLLTSDANSCSNFYLTEEKLYTVNPIARNLFGKSVDMAYLSQNGVLNIGQTVANTETVFLSENSAQSESFQPENTPLAGKAGLNAAVDKQILRHATPADFNAVAQMRSKNQDAPPVSGRRIEARVPDHMMYNAYVILKPFQIPAGLYGANSANFILAKGVPKPTGELGHSILYDLNDDSCVGHACAR